jgi:hypothetical protein
MGWGIWYNTTRVLPEVERDRHRIDVDAIPPCGFVAFTMKLAVVDSAQRNRELIRYLAAQCTLLRKSDVMRVRRLPAAHCARLSGDEADVILIPIAARLHQSEGAFVDAFGIELSGCRCTMRALLKFPGRA